MSQNIKSYLDVAPVVVASQHKHTPFGCFRRQVKKLEIDSKHLTKIKKMLKVLPGVEVGKQCKEFIVLSISFDLSLCSGVAVEVVSRAKGVKRTLG